MGIHGNLATMHLDDVLGWINMSQRDGVLTANRKNESKKIYFYKGNLIAVYTTSYAEKLGAILAKHRKIDEAALKKEINLNMDNPRVFGQVLLNRGAIDVADLHQAVQYQMEDVVCNLFGWKEGFFLYTEQEIPLKDLWPLKLGLQNLLLEGARRADDWSRLSAEFEPKIDEPLQIAVENDKRTKRAIQGPDLAVAYVLQKIDGIRTTNNILTLSTFSSVETLTAISKLLGDRLIRFVPPEQRKTVSPEEQARQITEDGEHLFSQGRLEEAIGTWHLAQEQFPRLVNVKDRLETAENLHYKGLISKIGSNSKVPKKRPEIQSLETANLYLNERQQTFLHGIDGVKSLRQLAALPGWNEKDAYFHTDRLLQMDYVML